ncbi:C40 family peptidase [Flavobacterium sp. TAB 87]|uniref:C40 family peptidase n=1 Tax=Flavobacterium sp. TAB 87 TaxID=1729581 RepID=UPI00076D8E95|nr:C40 family peptidase [Flavobacterium sp. TAB 87]KVV13777.1 putative endopeptidase Spr precursor [Flavobacterium sp. TAB 87]
MKKITLIVIALALFTACKSTAPTATSSTFDTYKVTTDLVNTASNNLGAKYKYAGTTKAGFDCSGLVYNTFQTKSISLPRSSYEQSKIGTIISIKKAQKGDLIFFKTNNSSKINHVGLITEVTAEEIKFIHSSTSKGVIISSTKQNYYKNSFAQINRVIN